MRASALAYGSLLALIPMLAVIMSVTSTFLKKEGEERIDSFIVKLVSTLTPPAALHSDTNLVGSENLEQITNTSPTVAGPPNGTFPSRHQNVFFHLALAGKLGMLSDFFDRPSAVQSSLRICCVVV